MMVKTTDVIQICSHEVLSGLHTSLWSPNITGANGREMPASVECVRDMPNRQNNLHEWRSMECMGFGEAISNITLEPKP